MHTMHITLYRIGSKDSFQLGAHLGRPKEAGFSAECSVVVKILGRT